jgi:hypothetical protein
MPQEQGQQNPMLILQVGHLHSNPGQLLKKKSEGGILCRVMLLLVFILVVVPNKVPNRLNLSLFQWKREFSDQTLVLCHNIFVQQKIMDNVLSGHKVEIVK